MDLKDIDSDIPIMLYVGQQDLVATQKDARWIREELKGKNGRKGPLIMYREIEAGHGTFLLGRNMDYWTREILHLIGKASENAQESSAIEALKLKP